MHMSDGYGLLLTVFMTTGAIGFGMLILGAAKGLKLRRLTRRYASRRFEEVEEGTPVRVAGRVVRCAEPRWRHPTDGSPVVLARLVARNRMKVVIDISRGQPFEIEDERGERAAILINDATIEGVGKRISLRWPPDEPMRAFLTPRARSIAEELVRQGRGGMTKLVAIKPGDAVEAMGVARRDPSKPQAVGYRGSVAQLVLGGLGEPPVIVVPGGLRVLLDQNRDVLLSGATLAALSSAIVVATILIA
jgi:hypothetical protein